MANSFQRQKGLTPVQQIPRMKKLHPQFIPRINRGAVNWTGQLTPTDQSRTYRIKIDYKLGERPHIWVIEPRLRRHRNGERIPHLYPGGDLCLYHPYKCEWRPMDFIADTIVPWASLWLYYYEVWHAIGEWLGGGEHPEINKSSRAR